MRVTRTVQISIFEKFSEHEYGAQLKHLSAILDQHPQLVDIVSNDLVDSSLKATGRIGLSAESTLRCMILKQQFGLSYDRLAFYLSDSMSFRAFARLGHLSPSRSGLQAAIRRIKPETLELAHQVLTNELLNQGTLDVKKLRVDSTVVASHIAPPSDSQLLNDAIRVISRLLAKSREQTGCKIRFADQRKAAKSLAFRIFNSKKTDKDKLYPKLLNIASVVLKQADRALKSIGEQESSSNTRTQWLRSVEYYRDLLVRVMEQTRRRVICGESVPSSEKIVSIFESHTDVIVKGFRDIQYGHKINLSTDARGFITALSIEEGNPSDRTLLLPILDYHQTQFGHLPDAVVADGGYASKANVLAGRELGVKKVVFHKPVGVSLTAMGVKQKTYDALKHFRAGIEGNISELKRAFGAGKAKWKGHDGFKAYVWASVLSYNLVRLARLNTG